MHKVIMVFLVIFILTYLGLSHIHKPAQIPEVIPPKEEIIIENNEQVVNPNEKPMTYEESLVIAKKLNKKVLLMFSASNCAPCQKMKNFTLNNEEIKKILQEKYVFFLMENNNDDIFRKYMISVTPSYRIIDKDENVLKKSAGYMDEQLFNKFLLD